jgi:hypothetical protein
MERRDMNGYIIKEINLVTYPAELRRIADDMETGWPKKRPGESTTVRVFLLDKKTVLKINCDQDKMI